MTEAPKNIAPIREKLQTEEWHAAVATTKELTTYFWAQVFAVAAIMGVEINGEEPVHPDPRFATEWKMAKLMARLDEPDSLATKENALCFASDIVFMDPDGQERHKLERTGVLSLKVRRQIEGELISLNADPKNDDLRLELIDKLRQDVIARNITNANGETPLAELIRLYRLPFKASWLGAYMVRTPDGQTKVAQVKVVGDFENGVPEWYINNHFDPTSNAGLPLLEAGQQFGLNLYVEDSSGQLQPIDFQTAFTLIVAKTLPEQWFSYVLENEGQAIEPLLADEENFANYWLLKLADDDQLFSNPVSSQTNLIK